MGIASFEVVGSGGMWRVKLVSRSAAIQSRKPPLKPQLLRLYRSFGKASKCRFQCPGNVLNPNAAGCLSSPQSSDMTNFFSCLDAKLPSIAAFLGFA